MIYTLDTNACIGHLRSKGQSPISRRLSAVNDTDMAISTIVRAELHFGALRSNQSTHNLLQVSAFLARFRSLPFDDPCATAYADIRAHLASLGTPIGPNDLFIAAIARTNGLVLVTHNTSEFARIPGLKIEDWEQP